MMAEKARLFGDELTRGKILGGGSPGAVKALGREVRGFNEETWCKNRFEIVVAGNLAKFQQNPELGAFLKGTGDRVLVEASPAYWAVELFQLARAAGREVKVSGVTKKRRVSIIDALPSSVANPTVGVLPS